MTTVLIPSASYLQGTVLKAVYIFIHLILAATLIGKF